MKLVAFLLDPRRLPSWLAVAAALGAGFLLVAEDSLLRTLHLETFRAEHQVLVGLVLLGGVAFALLGVLAWLLARSRASRGRRERATALDPAEQAVLRELCLQGRNTIAVPVNEPAVAGLLTDGVLAQVGGHVQPTPKGLVAAVRLDPAFRKQLEPEAIGLTTWTPAEAERRRLLPSRPAFVGEIARWDAIFQL